MNGDAKKRWGLAVALAVLTVLVYLPAMQGGFLWDDDQFLTENPFVRPADGLWRMWLPTPGHDYYPATWASYWLEWRLWGTETTGYHVTNVLLHVLGALLVWQVLQALRVRWAWLAALVFAVHPVGVESVAWISERKNVLSLVFYALTVLAYLRFERDGARRSYWWALGLFVLALLSKTSGVMLPFVLLLGAWWQRGTIDRRDLWRSVPFFLLAGAFGVLTIWSQHQIAPGAKVVFAGSLPATEQRDLLFRLGAAGHVFWFYLFKVLAPVGLMAIYPLWNFNTPTAAFWLPSLAVGGVIAGAWYWRAKGGRAVLMGVLSFGVMLFPVLGIFDRPYIGRSPVVTDHLQYLAMIGIIALVVGGIATLPRPAGNVLGVGVVGALLFLSWHRAACFQNEETLWTDTLAKNPAANQAHVRLANVFLKAGNLPAAVEHFADAVRLKPHDAKTRSNLAGALAQQGRIEEAIQHFTAALRDQPNSAEIRYNFGLALASRGRFVEAIQQFTRAIRQQPNYASAHFSLGNAHLAQKQFTEASAAYAAALRCQPNYFAAQYNWGIALAQAGQMGDAIPHLEEAVRLDPANPAARHNLGIALANQGRTAEARLHFAEAVRLNPGETSYRRALGALSP
jgi:tetratricopeptide (TPR) repeat protein